MQKILHYIYVQFFPVYYLAAGVIAYRNLGFIVLALPRSHYRSPRIPITGELLQP